MHKKRLLAAGLLALALLPACISSDVRHRRAIDESGQAQQRAQEGRFFYYTLSQVYKGGDALMSERGARRLSGDPAKGGWWAPLPYASRRLMAGLALKMDQEVTQGVISDKKEPFVRASWSFYDITSGQRVAISDPAFILNATQELNTALYALLRQKFGYESLGY
jgi:hypothetical protein